MPRAPKTRERPWQVVDQRRLSSRERGYDARWSEASARYRQAHPLCVACLLRGRVKASECVDHIVPIACVPELKWDEDNWAALCWSCHSYKTTKEPRVSWAPDAERVVVCGLPGTGKRAWAQERGEPYFDANERGLLERGAIIGARSAWIKKHNGPITVIVAPTVFASLVAREVRGVVRHMTTVLTG
jgi:5-methylcytosine-specific restriction protein A